MSTETCVEHPTEVENLPQKSTKKSLANDLVLENKNGVSELPLSAVDVDKDKAASLSPITPDSGRETGNFVLDFASPFTLASLSQRKDELCSSTNGSPRTPAGGVFDPFAPGPDKLMLAPHSNKCLQEPRSSAARHLNFDSSLDFTGGGKRETDAETISDDAMLLEAMYDNLLEAIVSAQTKCPAELVPLDQGSDGLKTPVSAARLTGIAETCPGAPMKRSRKSSIINRGLCRKLEF